MGQPFGEVVLDLPTTKWLTRRFWASILYQMPSLQDYYRDLLIWEGLPQVELIHTWPQDLVERISVNMRQAASAGQLIGLNCPIRARSTNQSIGNQVEESAIPILASRLSAFTLGRCSGAGYPDQVLFCNETRLKVPLEVKATSTWNHKDSNRRVLTSSSGKLRKQFVSPIYHLLTTIVYRVNQSDAVVEQIRLDFLEPSSPVSVRLEASVNHKLLSHGTHTSVII